MATGQTGGLNKDDHALLKRALKTHEHVTGERATHLADSIPVASDDDPEAKAKEAQRQHEATAKLAARVEETQQAERRARADQQAGTSTAGRPAESPGTPANMQPGNPGGGQEALATERAKAAGLDGKGHEPATAAPSSGT